MAVIPRATPAGAVLAAPGGVRAPQQDVSTGLNQLSQSLEALSSNMVQQRRSNDVARKKIEIYKRLGNLESEVSTGRFRSSPDLGFTRADTPGGDFSVATEAFGELSSVAREEVLSGIDDPRVREQVELEFDFTVAQKTATVRNAAVKQMRDQTVAELDVNTEQFARGFTEATTENERLSVVQAFRENLVQATVTGAITREDMVKRTQKFRNTVAELEVRKDLLGATRDADASEEVLNKLREPGSFPGLTPDARQSFEEQALRQFNSAVDFEFRLEERQERLATRQLKKRQEAKVRELSALIRPADENGEFGAAQIGHVEIDRAFQAGHITAPQTNYLRSLIERPDPTPDPEVRGRWRSRFTEQAYEGTLETEELLAARTAGYLTDNDVSAVDSIAQSRRAAGGEATTFDAKQARKFVTGYLFGVDSLFDVVLEDDEVRRVNAMNLIFEGRIGRGENPYRVASELVQEDSSAEVDVGDLPAQVQGLFLDHKSKGSLGEFWPLAKTVIEGDTSLSKSQRRSLVLGLELLQSEQGKQLERLPQILRELDVRAENWDRKQQ